MPLSVGVGVGDGAGDGIREVRQLSASSIFITGYAISRVRYVPAG